MSWKYLTIQKSSVSTDKIRIRCVSILRPPYNQYQAFLEVLILLLNRSAKVIPLAEKLDLKIDQAS